MRAALACVFCAMLGACAHVPPSPEATGLGWVRRAFRVEVRERRVGGPPGGVVSGPAIEARYTLSRSASHTFTGHAEATQTPRDMADPGEPETATRTLEVPEVAVDALLERIAALAAAAAPLSQSGGTRSEPGPWWAITVVDGHDERVLLQLEMGSVYDEPPHWIMIDPHGLLELDGAAMSDVLADLRRLVAEPPER